MSDWLANSELNEYASLHTQAESPILQKMLADFQNKPGGQMLSGRLSGQLLRFLVKMNRVQRALDIGTFIGYSALTLAEALPEKGQVITIESSKPTLELAQSYFAQSAYNNKIISLLGNAFDLIPGLDGEFDLIFIDADKNKILEYYELGLCKLKPDGIMVIDDVLWRGEVLQAEPHDKRAKAMKQLNQFILHDSRVENLLLPIRHGLQLIVKR